MKTKYRYILLACLLALLFFDLSLAQTSRDLERARAKWINYVKKNSKKVERLYLKQSLMITPEETVFGQQPIKQFISQNRDLFKPLSATVSAKIFEHSDRKVLDIGKIQIKDANYVVTDSLHYVIAWRKIGDDWMREVDIIFPTVETAVAGTELDALRSSWVKYANGDSPDILVSELFLRDAIYLNNSEMSKGHPAITKRFDFIKSPDFHINLKAEKVVPVDDQTIIDIGNWITNQYVGYYLMIWKKDENKSWKISLYFNF